MSTNDTFDAQLAGKLREAVDARVREAIDADVAARVWSADPTLWGGDASTPELSDRLGWLTIADRMEPQLPELEGLAARAANHGLTDVVLLGMGGSSLAPEVFRLSFPVSEHALRLHVLDSTDAGAVRAVEAAIDLAKTLFVVSSKSGSTIEPNSMFSYFWAKVGRGEQFIAVTDPGSSLEALAAEHDFRRVFHGDPEIGGRYSALSAFGLVPAALMGAPVKALVSGAQAAAESCRADSEANPGLALGVTLGELARHGRDKLTFVVDEQIESLGLWAEQLVAESTGKQSTGILPVALEPLGEPGVYGDDRVFLALGSENAVGIEALAEAGHPVIKVPTTGSDDLGRIMFLLEFATAVAGWALSINPFDQPNVAEAKANTNKVLEKGAPDPPEGDGTFVLEAAPPQYVAIMGYVEPSVQLDAALAELRVAIRAKTKATTTFGYGPRFLHSTGQFHKGGPATGVFLQLVHSASPDADIPGQDFSFATLKDAQATGDLQTLHDHGLTAERVRLEGDPAAAVRALAARLR